MSVFIYFQNIFMIFQACKTPKHSLIKKGSFALSFFVRVIPTNISKNSVLFDVCILDVQNGKFNTFQIIQAQICSTFHVFVIAASETSLQPQRSLNPCQMLLWLCYRLLYSLERGCLFSFSDSLLLPNIISFQYRCKGSKWLELFYSPDIIKRWIPV